MITIQQKLGKLLKKIENNCYSDLININMVELQKRIEQDTGCDGLSEAMALLGFLLKNRYVKFDVDSGLVLDQDRKAVIQYFFEL